MGKIFRGTKGNDIVFQSQFTANSAMSFFTGAGNDQIKLDRTDDLGGDNTVNAGGGKDIVVNLFEGGNRIAMGGGADLYVGTGFSLLNDFDLVDGGAGNDRFFVSTFISSYFGGTGDDFFASHGWENGFDGGDGIDTISYEFRHEDSTIGNQGVTIDLAANQVQTGAFRFEQVFNIENAKGSLNADIIGGTDGANLLMGLAGDDDLFGFGGNDLIEGGLGSDFIRGGTGADVFVYRNFRDSTGGAMDAILDFSRAEGDRIDISGLDADTGVAGNQAFTYLGIGAFTGDAGQARFANNVFQVDIDGDARADMQVQVQGTTFLLTADIIL